MSTKENDVKQEGANPSQVNDEKKPETEASEGVKTPDSENVPKDVYEKVREAMKTERQAKREEKARVAELEARLAKLEPQPERNENYDPYKAKTDLLFMMNKDNFLKENLDLVEAKMSDNPNMDVQTALTETKAEFFDRIQQEAQTVQPNQQLKQEKPSMTNEPDQPKSEYTKKSLLEGSHENLPPEVQAAYKRILGK